MRVCVAALLAALSLLPVMPAAGAAVGDRLPIVASFYPLFEFAREIGGSRVAVRNVVPAGAEPHDYEPTPRDILAMNQAKVLVYNGAGFEPWAERLLRQVPSFVIKVNATEGLPLAKITAGENRGRIDPHVWLDPMLAQRQVANVLAGLVRADPANRAAYGSGAAAYGRRLAALHDLLARTLAPCRKKVFVANHTAFSYLAARYGLTQIAISGVEPEAEPSAAKIREILRLVRQHSVTVIYYETPANPRVANTIAREVGARTLVLNPIEGLTDEEIARGKHYISVMEDNLRSLTQGLDCP